MKNFDKAWRLLGQSHRNWCQEKYYQDADGIFRFNALPNAVAFDIIAAVSFVHGLSFQDSKRLLINRGLDNPIAFNDSNDYKTVVNKLKELDI